MECRRSRLCWASIAVLSMWMALLLPPLRAGSIEWSTAPLPQIQYQAEQLEETFQWAKAAELWYQILARDRSYGQAKEHYQLCLRRAQQIARHQDATYRQQILSLPLESAIQVYGEVLAKLQADYVEQSKVQLPLLYKRGLEEIVFLLTDETLRLLYLSEMPRDTVRVFEAELKMMWADKPLRKAADAQNLARDIALAAKKLLGLKPALIVSELACGACNALDECTYFLSPGQFSEINASLRGETVGIGVEVGTSPEGLCIARVVPGSPAQANGVKEGERILRIGDKPAATLMSAEAAANLLKGDPDTTVELELGSILDGKRVLKLKRQVVRVPSVSEPRFLDVRLGIGYLQLLGFHETTLEELNLAISKLQSDGMRTLILDLRGNPGGLFDVARQVVERFVSTGVIVSTQGRVTGEHNAIFHAHGMNVLTVPLVVLVDGETASSAEMVAGALKENLRGKLVGKTTFGKGSIQKVKGLNSVHAGIRMTVAKFYSPRQQAYDGSGVAPNLEVEFMPPTMSMEPDSQVQAALEVARSLALGQRSDGGPN